MRGGQVRGAEAHPHPHPHPHIHTSTSLTCRKCRLSNTHLMCNRLHTHTQQFTLTCRKCRLGRHLSRDRKRVECGWSLLMSISVLSPWLLAPTS